MKFKFFRRFKRRLAHHARLYAVIGLFVAVLGVGAWFAATSEGPEVQVMDFGDALTSKNAQSISKASYEDALVLIEEGKMDDARKIMTRLAPLSAVTETPQGNGKAHLWVAQQDLGSGEVLFLERFPLEYSLTQPSQPAKVFREDLQIKEIVRHLEIAVKLSPELNEAYLLLASMKLWQSKRDEALNALMAGISDEQGIHDSLLIALANTTTYEGDELELKEWAWLGFSTLGHEVAGRGRGSLSQRLGYAAYALLLGKYEVVDLVVKRIERDFSGGARSELAGRVAQSLKMAVPYFKAIAHLEASHTSGDYTPVVSALVKALVIQPENVTLVLAVQQVVREMPALRPKVKQWLDESGIDGVDEVVKNGVGASLFYLLMSDLSEERIEKRKYLERALAVSAHDPDILLALVQLRLKAAEPAYEDLKRMLKEVELGMPHGSPKLTEVYWAQGQVLFHLQEIPESIGRLERALALSSEKAEVHRLLAQAYQKAGHPELAKVHGVELKTDKLTN